MAEITIDDFKNVEIKIGTVVEAVVPEWSHWVMKLTVDLGEELGQKTIFSGIMKFYEPQDLIGKQFPFVVNLKPKKIGPEGDMSEGMMLMAVPSSDSTDEETKPILFNLGENVPNGTRVG